MIHPRTVADTGRVRQTLLPLILVLTLLPTGLNEMGRCRAPKWPTLHRPHSPFLNLGQIYQSTRTTPPPEARLPRHQHLLKDAVLWTLSSLLRLLEKSLCRKPDQRAALAGVCRRRRTLRRKITNSNLEPMVSQKTNSIDTTNHAVVVCTGGCFRRIE